jgi:hypothetical protein
MQLVLRSWPILVALALPGIAGAAEFRVEETDALAGRPLGALKPHVIVLSDGSGEGDRDGLMAFEDWARDKPLQKRLLSLYPAYQEPTVTVDVNGLKKRHKEKLHVYVVEARFLLEKPPESIDLGRFATLDLVEAIDPAIKHKRIEPGEAIPNRDPEFAYNRIPERAWCEDPKSLCMESRYQLEGKLPVGIRLANKLQEGGKTIAEHLAFQSELRVLPPGEAEAAGLAELTGIAAPVTGALEQNLFYVNQVIQAGKLLLVLQQHPEQPQKTVATVFMSVAVESDVLERKKEYERVPVLRNLVPAQVLMGNSSFNTGQSISAGLPSYARNRIAALADLLERR